MKRLNSFRMRLVLVGFVAVVVLGGGNAKADFAFGDPVNLGAVVNSSSMDGGPHISSDGLEMYFDSDRPGGSGSVDIWVSRRATTDDDWGAPEWLGPSINSSGNDGTPCISADGLTLYFHSERPGGFGYWDLWVTTRLTKNDSWGQPVNLGPMVNSPTYEFSPKISVDGLVLYFESRRPGGYGVYDIWTTSRPSTEDDWGDPVNLGPAVNGPARDQGPFISSDGLILFLTSDRPGGYGSWDLWFTRRTTLHEAWGEPVNLGPKVNASYLDGWPCLSPDGKSLYMSSQLTDTVSTRDIWQVPIISIVDLNGDGNVDGFEVRKMADHWDTDTSLCDIGPMPWGDGVVDVKDLVVLAEYIGQELDDPTLVARWALDETEGMIAYDGAAENDATVLGSPVWQPGAGMVNGALQLGGAGDCLMTDFVVNPADGPFSVFVWVKGGTPGQVVISQWDFDSGADWLAADPVQGRLMTELRYAGRGGNPLCSETVITDGDWHRVAFTWDGSYRTLYVDDMPVAEDAQKGLADVRGGLYIGCDKDMTPGTFWSGLIDDVRIYNRAVKL